MSNSRSGMPTLFDVDRATEYSRALLSALPESAAAVVDANGIVLVAEGELLERHGYLSVALVGRQLREVLPAPAEPAVSERVKATLAGEPQSFDYRTRSGQKLCWVKLTPMYFGHPDPVAALAVIQDVTERDRLTSELQTERERRRMAEEVAGVGHWEIDLQTDSVILSEGARRQLGMRAKPNVQLKTVLRHIDASHRAHVVATLNEASASGMAECECELEIRGGRRRRVLMRGMRNLRDDGHEVVTGTTIDITELRAAEQTRTEFEELFRQGFDGSPIGMTLTHPGDGRYLRVNDAFCRMLGRSREELLSCAYSDVTDPEDAELEDAARAQLTAGERNGYELEKRYLRLDGSVLWTSLHVVPVFGRDGEIRAFFSQVVDLTARKEREMRLLQEATDLERLADIRAALKDDRFLLHAQPIISLRTGEIVQQELLIRLQREDGIVAACDFLPVAERYGCIHEIDHWVVRRAIEIAAEGEPVEVNLSAASVGDEGLLTAIREKLLRTGADPGLIVFEVTETALMADVERGAWFVTALRGLGCRFALDDFGTGYGTFTYLKHIPIDYLKIDIEFVRDLTADQANERLVRAIVTMARELGKQTIAEGVEDEETLERVRELGVDHAQGYHIGRPAPVGHASSPATGLVISGS